MILVAPRALMLRPGEFFRSPRVPVDPLTARLELRLKRPTTGGSVVWDDTAQLAVKLLLFVDGVEYKLGGKASGGIRTGVFGEDLPEYVLTWNPTVRLGAKGREFMRTRSPNGDGFYRNVPLTRLGEEAAAIEAQIIVESRSGPAVDTEILLAELLSAPAPTRSIKNSVAFDASTSAQEIAGDGVLSLSHTAAGTNRAAFIGCGNAQPDPPLTTSVTYGGASATEMWDVTGQTFFVNAGYRIVNPATGAQTVIGTLAGSSSNFLLGVISMTGVHQSTPVGTAVTANGATTTPSVTVSDAASGDLVVDNLVGFGTAEPTVSANQTLAWDELGVANSIAGGGSYQAGADGGVMSWTQTDNPLDAWVIGAVAFKPGASVADAAITEEDDTLAAAGSLAISATAAIAEEDDALVAASSVAIAASASITEEDDGLSAQAGAEANNAAASITEEDDSLASTATVAIAASAALTEDDDSLVAAVALALAAAAGITEEDDSLLSAASFPISAAFLLTEEDDTLFATVIDPSAVGPGIVRVSDAVRALSALAASRSARASDARVGSITKRDGPT